MLSVPSMITALLLLLSLLIVAGFHCRRQKSRARYCEQLGCEPPRSYYPHIDKVLGLDLLILSWLDVNSHRYSERARQRYLTYGSTYVSLAWGRTVVNTIEPENIAVVTTANFNDYIKTDWAREVGKHLGKGILINDGHEWKASRDLLKSTFRRNRKDDLLMLDKHIRSLIDFIKEREGEDLDFRRLSNMYTMDVTTELLFGTSTDILSAKCEGEIGTAENGPELEFFHLVDCLEPLASMFINFGPLAGFVYLLRRKEIMGLITGIQSFFRTVVKKELAKNYPDDSVRLTIHDADSSLDPRQDVLHTLAIKGIEASKIQGELQNIFFAAYDTTTALLTNLMDILGRRPEVVSMIKNEVESLRSSSVSEYDLSRMTYLRYTILETLRLFSPVTVFQRKACRDTILPRGGGSDGRAPIFISKGQIVTWSTYALNRQEDIYGNDSLDFRPDRWANIVPSHAWLPFGSGPRNCLGQQFAMLNISYVVVRLLQSFNEVVLQDHKAFQEAKAVTYYNGLGTVVRIT